MANKTIYTTLKTRLKPNDEQLNLFKQSAGIRRFTWNFSKGLSDKFYKKTGKTLKQSTLRKRITMLRNHPDYKWMKNVSCDVPKQAAKDFCKARTDYLRGNKGKPQFKAKNKGRPSFYCDSYQIKVGNHSVYLAKIGWVKTAEQLPGDTKIYNPTISFDNKYWYLSVAIEIESFDVELTNDVIGIDLGLKMLATCSNGLQWKNINKTSRRLKLLNKRLKRLQRKQARQYENIKQKEISVTTACNYQKTLTQIRHIYRAIKNIRLNHIHQLTNKLVKAKPSKIVIEDLNVRGMMKNKYLAQHVANCLFYEIRRQLTYKCERYGIQLIIADRFYPSSQLCASCGERKTGTDKLTLSDREYKCSHCSYHQDRDMNAAINLETYGRQVA